MPHISTKRIKKKVFLDISDWLIQVVAMASNKTQSRHLILELLTPTERIMLTKRLAMVLLLGRGMSPYKVKKVLKISSSTVARFSHQIEAGRYQYLSLWLKENRLAKNSNIWEDLERVLFGILPPRAGKNRQLFSPHHR